MLNKNCAWHNTALRAKAGNTLTRSCVDTPNRTSSSLGSAEYLLILLPLMLSIMKSVPAAREEASPAPSARKSFATCVKGYCCERVLNQIRAQWVVEGVEGCGAFWRAVGGFCRVEKLGDVWDRHNKDQ